MFYVGHKYNKKDNLPHLKESIYCDKKKLNFCEYLFINYILLYNSYTKAHLYLTNILMFIMIF